MIKILKNMRKKDWLLVLIIFLFVLLQVYLDLKMPDYMSEVTKLVQTENSKFNDILLNGFYMLLCAFGSLISSFAVGFLATYLASKFSENLRYKLFNKITSFSMAEVKEFKTDSLITRTTNDVTQIEMLIGMGLNLILKAPTTAIWAISKILNKNFEWSALTGVAVIVLLTVITIIMIIVIPRFKKIQKLIDKVNGLSRENINGIRVVRAFNAYNYQQDKFDKTNKELTNLQEFNQKKFALFTPVMYLVMNSLALLIYFTGAYLISNAALNLKLDLFSDMIVFSSYALQVIISFLMLAFIFMIVPRADVSARRINEVLDKKVSIKEGNIVNKKDVGTVEFINVSFKYPDADEYILKDISFSCKKGETVAFIGSTGSGKSTLVNLIPRFYDVTDGKILVDGIDVREYKSEVLNNIIGYVSQKAVIFDDSVEENIAYSNNVNKDKLKKAIEVSQAKDFVDKIGVSAHLSKAGTNISGGQKQRISIARAIYKNPEIYIFDDTFSALDYKTDLKLRKELKKYTKDATVLIVAQRIGTIMNADKIMVLDEGKCVGVGTHKELLKTCKVYQEIAYLQFRKEELDNA